jgi:hypothetical protein
MNRLLFSNEDEPPKILLCLQMVIVVRIGRIYSHLVPLDGIDYTNRHKKINKFLLGGLRHRNLLTH